MTAIKNDYRVRGTLSAVSFVDAVRDGAAVRDLHATITTAEGSFPMVVAAASMEKRPELRDLVDGPAYVYGRFSKQEPVTLTVTHMGIEDGPELDAKRAQSAKDNAAKGEAKPAAKAETKAAAKPAGKPATASATPPAATGRIYTLMAREGNTVFGVKGTLASGEIRADGSFKGRILWQRPAGIEECLITVPKSGMGGAFGAQVMAATADRSKTISARVRSTLLAATAQNKYPIQALFVVQGLVPGASNGKTASAPAANKAAAGAAMAQGEPEDAGMMDRPFAPVTEEDLSGIPF